MLVCDVDLLISLSPTSCVSEAEGFLRFTVLDFVLPLYKLPHTHTDRFYTGPFRCIGVFLALHHGNPAAHTHTVTPIRLMCYSKPNYTLIKHSLKIKNHYVPFKTELLFSTHWADRV